MAFGKRLPKIIPDDVFAGSPFLQELQRHGLYDQDGPSNVAREPSLFQVVPETLILELGNWAASFIESAAFRNQVKPVNEIRLPNVIISAILREERPINPPWDPYADFVRGGLQYIVRDVAPRSGMRPGDTGFEQAFAGTLASWVVGYLAPRLTSGELPLSLEAPGCAGMQR